MNIKKYFKIWLKTTSLSLQSNLFSWGASIMYIVGKIIRFIFFLLLIVIVLQQTKYLAGYNLSQLIVFFLIFHLADMLGQLIYRGIYFFRNEVISGHFDLTLVKPVNALFQVLTAHTDVLDIPLLPLMLYLFFTLKINITLPNFFLFLLIFICSLLIITAIHIFIACIGVITTEVDHIIWIYRDLSGAAKVPVDIYIDSVRFFLTFIIPIAIIFTFPAKALMGILSWQWVLFSIIFSLLLFWLSLKFWQYALTKYSSASS